MDLLVAKELDFGLNHVVLVLQLGADGLDDLATMPWGFSKTPHTYLEPRMGIA